MIVDLDNRGLHLGLGRDNTHLRVSFLVGRHHQHEAAVLAQSRVDLALLVVANLKLGDAGVQATLLAHVEYEQFASHHNENPIVHDFELLDLSLKDDFPDKVFL